MTAVLDRPTGSGPTSSGPPPATPAPPRGRLARAVRGPEHDPAWSRPALLTLLSPQGAQVELALGKELHEVLGFAGRGRLACPR